MSEPEILPPKEKKKPRTRSGKYSDRLLAVLTGVAEDDEASRQEKLLAAKMCLDVLSRRPPPKRKTDRDKAFLQAMGQSTTPTTALDRPKNPVPINFLKKKPLEIQGKTEVPEQERLESPPADPEKLPDPE